MNIIITNTEVQKVNNTIYTYNSLLVENKELVITVVSGSSNYINVLVKNAAQKAFKGIGKDFTNIEEALNNYKDLKIKAAINYIKGL